MDIYYYYDIDIHDNEARLAIYCGSEDEKEIKKFIRIIEKNKLLYCWEQHKGFNKEGGYTGISFKAFFKGNTQEINLIEKWLGKKGYGFNDREIKSYGKRRIKKAKKKIRKKGS